MDFGSFFFCYCFSDVFFVSWMSLTCAVCLFSISVFVIVHDVIVFKNLCMHFIDEISLKTELIERGGRREEVKQF